MAGQTGIGGSIEKLEISGDFSSRANPTATGGTARTGTVYNTANGLNFGLVKMLALAGFALIAWRLSKGGKK